MIKASKIAKSGIIQIHAARNNENAYNITKYPMENAEIRKRIQNVNKRSHEYLKSYFPQSPKSRRRMDNTEYDSGREDRNFESRQRVSSVVNQTVSNSFSNCFLEAYKKMSRIEASTMQNSIESNKIDHIKSPMRATSQHLNPLNHTSVRIIAKEKSNQKLNDDLSLHWNNLK